MDTVKKYVKRKIFLKELICLLLVVNLESSVAASAFACKYCKFMQTTIQYARYVIRKLKFAY